MQDQNKTGNFTETVNLMKQTLTRWLLNFLIWICMVGLQNVNIFK